MNGMRDRTRFGRRETLAQREPAELDECDLVEELTVAAVAPGSRRLDRLEELLEELRRRTQAV